MNNIAQIRILSDVPRWSIVRTIRKQNVAEHSFHVTIIAEWIVNEYFGDLSTEDRMILMLDVLTYSLHHDEDESITGDMPSTDKRRKEPRPNRSQTQKIVKVADIIEAMAFLAEDMSLGAQNNKQVWKDLNRNLRIALHDLFNNEEFEWDVSQKIFQFLNSLKGEHNYAAYIQF